MNSIKFSADMNKTGFPFIEVTEGTLKGACFLVDSGSNNNLLFNSLPKEMRRGIQVEDTRSSLSGIDGQGEPANTAKGRISFFGAEKEISFLLTKKPTAVIGMQKQFGFRIDGLIGNDYMLPNRWVIDLYAKEIVVRQRLILDCA